MADIQFGGSVEAIAQSQSYVDNDGAYMDLDTTNGYAQFGAKRAAGAGSLGTKIRTILAGVVKDAITIAASGLLITLLSGSTLAAQAITGTTLNLTGNLTISASSAQALLNRSATNQNAAVLYQTASGNDWLVGPTGATTGTTSDYQIYSYGTSSVVFSLARSTGAATLTNTSGVTATLSKSTGASLAFDQSGTVRFSLNGLNGSDGLAFNEGAGFTERGRISGGIFAWGTTVTTGAIAGMLVMPNNTTIGWTNAAGTSVIYGFAIDINNRAYINANSLSVRVDNALTSASASAGAASALPANPVGYLVLNILGTDRKVPYYAT